MAIQNINLNKYKYLKIKGLVIKQMDSDYIKTLDIRGLC